MQGHVKIHDILNKPELHIPVTTGEHLEGIEKNPRQTSKPLRIGAISVVAIHDGAQELNLFLGQVRFYHPEFPVYVIADQEALDLLEDRFREDSRVIMDVLTQDQIDRLASKVKADDHGPRWSVAGIACKFEVMKRAMRQFPKQGVLMCDVDLIFTRRLQATEWDADLVLSTHQGPLAVKESPDLHGTYNAGLVLCQDYRIIARWNQLYKDGVGGFYEQKCLEHLSEEFVTDVFPSSWNWGGWRHRENLTESKRNPPILHTHMEGKFASQGPKFIKAKAQNAIETRKISETTPNRVLFAHVPKAAGTSFMTLHAKLQLERNYQVLDSWGSGLRRDWSPSELSWMSQGKLFGQHGERWVAHNHIQNIPAERAQEFVNRGWVIVALYRPVRERLISLFYWGKDRERKGLPNPMGKKFESTKTLDEFIPLVMSSHEEKNFVLPDWHELITHWYSADTDGIELAYEEIFSLDVTSPNANQSSSRGYDHAVKEGLISPGTLRMIESDQRVRDWDEIVKKVRKRSR